MTNGGIINLLYFNYTSSDYQTIFVNLIHVHCLKCESRICMSDSLIEHNADGETSIEPLFDNIMTKGGIIIGTFV